MTERKPHPANVPGDFYVEESCCTMCGAPFIAAPDLFDSSQDPEGYEHCYVSRQPGSPEELDQMVWAIEIAELQCIRYRGSDRLVQLRLVESGEGIVCDRLPGDLQQETDRYEAERERQQKERWQAQQVADSHKPAPPRPWWRFW